LASKGIESFESETFKSYLGFYSACSYILYGVTNLDISKILLRDEKYVEEFHEVQFDSSKQAANQEICKSRKKKSVTNLKRKKC